MDSTLSIWNITPARAKKIGHPAPFPEELPERFIKLFSMKKILYLIHLWKGTTAVAAKNLGRNYIGYEIKKEYVELSKERLKTLANLPNSKQKTTLYKFHFVQVSLYDYQSQLSFIHNNYLEFQYCFKSVCNNN